MNNSANYKDLKIPYKFDSRCIVEDSSSRIFRLLGENKTIELLINNTKLPFVFSEENKPINFEYILTEASSYDSFKEITWFLACKQIQTPIKLSFNLTDNTLDNTVLVVFEMSIVKRELVPDIYKEKIIFNFEDIAVEFLNNVIIKLKNDYKDIYHYESKIFNYSREKLKNILFNLNDILLERGYISSIKREGKPYSEGEIYTITIPNKNKLIKLKLCKIRLNEKKIKWTFSYMPLDVNFKDYLVDWYIIKIKHDETLLAINNLYSEQIEPDFKKELSKKKKKLFEIIEEELIKKYPE